MEYDYYKILGIARTASADEVKKAYHHLAKTYHPDISDDPKANEFFAEVNNAYETLSDREKRRRYDMDLRRAYRQVRSQQPMQEDRPSRSGRRTTPDFRPFQEEPAYKGNPVMYNLLFVFGMIMGVILVLLSIHLFRVAEGVQKLASFLVFPGLILIRDGWAGLTWKSEPWALKFLKQLRGLFRIDFDSDS